MGEDGVGGRDKQGQELRSEDCCLCLVETKSRLCESTPVVLVPETNQGIFVPQHKQVV